MPVRIIGVGEMLLSVPLLALAVVVLGGIPVNGLIILMNASASYLLGRHTYSNEPTVGNAVLNLVYLLVAMLCSYGLCRIIACGS